MKRTIAILILIPVLIALLAGGAIAEEFKLRNEIQFGESLTSVKEKEQLKLTKEDETNLTYEGTVASYQGEVDYTFDSSKGLTDMCYDISEYDNKSTSHESIYESLSSSITNKYGSALGNPMGKTHQILGKAFENSIQMCSFISGFMGKKADIVDYEEWYVECDGGAVKIDLVDYYFTNSEDRQEYHVLLSYHFSSESEISTLVQENQEKTDAINNDI